MFNGIGVVTEIVEDVFHHTQLPLRPPETIKWLSYNNGNTLAFHTLEKKSSGICHNVVMKIKFSYNMYLHSDSMCVQATPVLMKGSEDFRKQS